MTYHSKIRQELLDQISRMQPGERIPNELHLAEFFGVSRMTVNKVISELAREGFLVRGRGRGSFVARKKTSRKIVSILLPSATLIPQDLQYIISGATEAARKMGVGIELITVSPDNNKDHIDFSALDHLTEDSYVFVVSNWFHRVFPFLWQKKCKTLLLDRQLLQFAPQNEFIKEFQILDCDIQSMVRSAFQRLYDAGCRRIAFRGTKPVLESITCHYYELELERKKMKGLVLPQDNFSIRLSAAELDMIEKFQPDGLIFDAHYIRSLVGQDLWKVANIPENIALEMIRFTPELNFLDHCPSAFEINGAAVGEAAIEMLMNHGDEKYRKIKPLHHPESKKQHVQNISFFEVI